jgi:alpha,alpha-trehalase
MISDRFPVSATNCAVRRRARLSLALVALGVIGCQAGPPRGGSVPIAFIMPAPHVLYDPSRDLGPLFADVQMASVFPDSKTFADANPIESPSEVAALYAAARKAGPVDLAGFVKQHFVIPGAAGEGVKSDPSAPMEVHIDALWKALARPMDGVDAHSSRIPLPAPYVVPGGRFREIYYWDSYFTMLGLVASGRTDLMRGMLDDFAYLVRTHGHIPNGTRTYYLSRSQPPYFAAMVGLFATATDSTQALQYLEPMESEYAFWMDGADRTTPGTAVRRVVRLADGTLLNRYWDDRNDPRPESYREDVRLAASLPDSARPALWRNIRAAAESGWDFSSRWMRDPADLRTLETTALAPVDLNALLYHAERTIAALRRLRHAPGDAAVATRFDAAADARRSAIQSHFFDAASGFFFDLRWKSGELVTDRPTLAAATPLYFGVATPQQGQAVAARLAKDFLRSGGFVTTTIASGQQWDAPNGWAPLQWLAIEGSRRAGRADIADQGRDRWLALNRRVYSASGKMTEKYDVLDAQRASGGGEYPTQDGFGWTNGVALALARQRGAQ